MAEEEVGLRLALKNRHETVAGLDDVGDKMDRVGDEAASVGRKARIGAAGLVTMGKAGRISGRAMVYGIGAASAAVVGAGIVLTKLSKDSIAEAREAQKVGGVTRREITATGKAANVSVKQVGNLATAISKKVGIDDEEIQSGANLVLMYKNVQNQQGKGNKIFNRSIRDATDMAAVTGTLTTSSKVLGKVLNDPLKALTGLSKYGVTWTESQQKQIKYDVEHNKVLDAQKLILDQVEGRVGGVAAAQATWGEKASVTIGNLKEDFGTILLPLLDRTEKWFVQKGGPVLDDYIGKFETKGVPAIEHYAGVFESRGIPAIKRFAQEARPIAESILPAIGTGLHTAADAVKIIAPRLKSVFDGFNSLPGWAKEAIAVGAGAAVVGQKLGIWSKVLGSGSNGILGAVSMAKPLPVYVVNKPGVPGVPGVPTAPVPGEPGGVPKPVAIGGTVLGLGLAAATLGGVVDAPGDKWYQNGLKAVDTKDVLSGAEAEKFLADRRTAAFKEWFDAQTVGYAKSSAALREQLARTLSFDAGINKTKASGQQLIGVLREIDRDWTPSLTIEGINDAESRLISIQSKMTQLSYMGIGGSAPSTSSSGGGGGHHGKSGHHSGRFATPDMPRISDDFWDDGDEGPMAPLHVHVHVGEHEIGSAVLKNLDDRLARK